MNPGKAIHERLTAKRGDLRKQESILAEVAQRIEMLKVEVATWEEAFRLTTGVMPSTTYEVATTPTSQNNKLPEVPEDSRRGPKGVWRVVMPEMVRQYPKEIFSLPDVAAAGELNGHTVKTNTLRTQMANYVKGGLLERVTNGRFRFTNQGRRMFAGSQDKPSDFSLATESPSADDAQADGVRGGYGPEASSGLVSIGGGSPQ